MVTDPGAAVSPAPDVTPAVAGRYELPEYATVKAVRCDRLTSTRPGDGLVDASATRWGWS